MAALPCGWSVSLKPSILEAQATPSVFVKRGKFMLRARVSLLWPRNRRGEAGAGVQSGHCRLADTGRTLGNRWALSGKGCEVSPGEGGRWAVLSPRVLSEGARAEGWTAPGGGRTEESGLLFFSCF